MGELEVLEIKKQSTDDTLERIDMHIQDSYSMKANSPTRWKFVYHRAYYSMVEVNREINAIVAKYGWPLKENYEEGDSCIDDAFPGYLVYSYRFLYPGDEPHMHVVTFVSKL